LQTQNLKDENDELKKQLVQKSKEAEETLKKLKYCKRCGSGLDSNQFLKGDFANISYDRKSFKKIVVCCTNSFEITTLTSNSQNENKSQLVLKKNFIFGAIFALLIIFLIGGTASVIGNGNTNNNSNNSNYILGESALGGFNFNFMLNVFNSLPVPTQNVQSKDLIDMKSNQLVSNNVNSVNSVTINDNNIIANINNNREEDFIRINYKEKEISKPVHNVKDKFIKYHNYHNYRSNQYEEQNINNIDNNDYKNNIDNINNVSVNMNDEYHELSYLKQENNNNLNKKQLTTDLVIKKRAVSKSQVDNMFPNKNLNNNINNNLPSLQAKDFLSKKKNRNSKPILKDIKTIKKTNTNTNKINKSKKKNIIEYMLKGDRLELVTENSNICNKNDERNSFNSNFIFFNKEKEMSSNNRSICNNLSNKVFVDSLLYSKNNKQSNINFTSNNINKPVKEKVKKTKRRDNGKNKYKMKENGIDESSRPFQVFKPIEFPKHEKSVSKADTPYFNEILEFDKLRSNTNTPEYIIDEFDKNYDYNKVFQGINLNPNNINEYITEVNENDKNDEK